MSGFSGPPIGQAPGSATNDAANAGNVGELIISNAQGVAATVTMTIASPAVITWTGHNLTGIVPVTFTTTGALPTGIVSGTVYWTLAGTLPGNTFQVASSIANALAGTAVNTSGSQSGTHTGTQNTVLTTGTPANVAAISLTAGDWEIEGASYLAAAASTVVTSAFLCINATSATLDTATGNFAGLVPAAAGLTGPADMVVLPRRRISLAATTTYYLVAQAAFSVAGFTANGALLRARRVR